LPRDRCVLPRIPVGRIYPNGSLECGQSIVDPALLRYARTQQIVGFGRVLCVQTDSQRLPQHRFGV
jgi:hypothetical protein